MKHTVNLHIHNLVDKIEIVSDPKIISHSYLENRCIDVIINAIKSASIGEPKTAERYLKADLKEINYRINPVQKPIQDTANMTARSSLEVLLDMVVCQSQLSKYTASLSKSEFLRYCTDRLSFSYDQLQDDAVS